MGVLEAGQADNTHSTEHAKVSGTEDLKESQTYEVSFAMAIIQAYKQFLTGEKWTNQKAFEVWTTVIKPRIQLQDRFLITRFWAMDL